MALENGERIQYPECFALEAAAIKARRGMHLCGEDVPPAVISRVLLLSHYQLP
jgi:hypothetical protein